MYIWKVAIANDITLTISQLQLYIKLLDNSLLIITTMYVFTISQYLINHVLYTMKINMDWLNQPINYYSDRHIDVKSKKACSKAYI